MTRPNLSVGVLAAVCVGTLLWCAWLILAADLPRGAHIASWFLWLISTAAAVTLLAYLREFLAHREAVGSDASWKPLPGLVLLWIGGLTAMVSFAFILPEPTPSGSSAPHDRAGTALTSATSLPTATRPTSTSPRSTPSGTSSEATGSAPSGVVSTSASRSAARTSPLPSGSTTPTRTGSASPTTSASRTSTPSGSTSSTTSPLIDLHILPTRAHPTTPPGR